MSSHTDSRNRITFLMALLAIWDTSMSAPLVLADPVVNLETKSDSPDPSSSPKDKLVGTWVVPIDEDNRSALTFNADGTFELVATLLALKKQLVCQLRSLCPPRTRPRSSPWN
jgi:hypothetical protein